jgi:hypothetical protein
MLGKVFPENRGVYEIMWGEGGDVVEPYMPRITIQYGACALHAG